VLWETPGRGAPLRPYFEPTDLELEEPGVVDLDLQSGFTYGRRALGNRWVLVDVEVDVGLAPNVELDVDAAFADEALGDGTRQWRGDALWPSMKLGFADLRAGAHAVALGAQLGPRFATINGGAGAGYAALALAGWSWRALHLVLNGGFLVEPGATPTSGRPSGVLIGADLVVDLDARWALTAEIGGAALPWGGPGEAHHTLGLLWSPTPRLAFSVVFLEGIFPNGDRAGVLFGVSPKLAAF
jgi:hypothetical protein